MKAAAALVAVVLLPGVAWACATCVASAYGDRTFNWAFLGLILMPFVVGAGIAAVFATRYYRWHRSEPAGSGPLTPHEESSL